MDQLRQGIGLRAYAQKNPKQEYKRESFDLFGKLLDSIKYDTIRYLSHIEVRSRDDMDRLEQQRRKEQQNREYLHAQTSALSEQENDDKTANAREPIIREGPKIGRNDPCHCGSGKKYKQCHGKI
jgi:preprotein translocase subunit SecA